MRTPLDYISDWADGMRCWQAVCGLQSQPILSAEQATKAGLKRSAELISYARKHSPFYANYYADIPADSLLEAYPAVKRSTLMQNFDDWASDRRISLASVQSFLSSRDNIGERFLNEYLVWTSSGTSGEKGIYVQDINALSIYQSLMLMRYQSFNTSRMAMIAALEGHFAGIVYWKWASRLNPWLTSQTRAFSILEPVELIVQQLNEWQPKCLLTYPSMFSVLAKEQECGRLAISPTSLWCGGEHLDPMQKQQIEAAFACGIVEDYGASEAMNMAFACEHGKLHINTDWFILEPVDEHMQAVPKGEKSATTLVTNLANKLQPIIRYDIGDSITLDTKACTCANPLPTLQVVGRNDDTLWLLGMHKQMVPILPLTLNTVVEENANEFGFQIIQLAPQTLSIRTEGITVNDRRRAFERIRDSLQQYFTSIGVLPLLLQYDTLPPERDAVSGKLNQVRKMTD